MMQKQVTVECDGPHCGSIDTFGTASFATAAEFAHRNGWLIHQRNGKPEHLCPCCAARVRAEAQVK